MNGKAHAVIDRIFIDVANGISARMLRFRKAGMALSAELSKANISPDAAQSASYNALRSGLVHKIRQLSPTSVFKWPVAIAIDNEQNDTYMLALPLYTSRAFLDFDTISVDFHVAKLALQLARRAEMTSVPLSREEGQYLGEIIDDSAWLLPSLAAEILTQHGVPTLPQRLTMACHKLCPNFSDKEDSDQSFSSRINVDGYNQLELLHPAYARQVVAMAQDIVDFLPQEHDINAPLSCIDIGAGPGLPLLMLRELIPSLQIHALEPDELAFAYLQKNTSGNDGITLSQTGFLEFESTTQLPLMISTGASHHLNTAFFFQKIFSVLEEGGIVVVADEFLPPFKKQEERMMALIKHHGAYIVATMAGINEWCISEINDPSMQLYRQFQKQIPLAIYEAETGLVSHAVNRCRNLLDAVKQIDTKKNIIDPLEAYARFFTLELEALVAGFDYEVERKTYPQHLLHLAQLAGLQLLRHRRIFATTGHDEYAGGTHVFSFRKPKSFRIKRSACLCQ